MVPSVSMRTTAPPASSTEVIAWPPPASVVSEPFVSSVAIVDPVAPLSSSPPPNTTMPPITSAMTAAIAPTMMPTFLPLPPPPPVGGVAGVGGRGRRGRRQRPSLPVRSLPGPAAGAAEEEVVGAASGRCLVGWGRYSTCPAPHAVGDETGGTLAGGMLRSGEGRGGTTYAPAVADPLVIVDDPRPAVRRLTLNRPDKRNALSNALRGELFAALRDGRRRPVTCASIVIRGAGPCFSAGYDLAQDPSEPLPWPIIAGRRRLGAPRRARLVRDVGHGHAAHRPGARVLPRRRHRAGHGVRPRLRRRTTRRSATRRCGSMSPPDMAWQPWLLGHAPGDGGDA